MRAFGIAGYEVRIRFAGPAMHARLTPALEHLATEPTDAPDWTILAWDRASTGTPMVPPAWSPGAYSERGLIAGFNDDRFQTHVQAVNSTLSMIDHARSRSLYWIPDAERVTYYETISPLRTLIHWWMARHGRRLAHAAAIGTTGSGILLPARGGSGKSTTALVCLEAGMLYAGDNNILVETDARPPRAHGIYQSTALHSDHLDARLPHLRPLVRNPDHLAEQKAFLLLADRFGDRMVDSLPIRAVVVPRVAGRTETRVLEGSAEASLAALLPSTVISLPGADRSGVDALAGAIRPLPHYTLELGTDLTRIPRVVADLLGSLE